MQLQALRALKQRRLLWLPRNVTTFHVNMKTVAKARNILWARMLLTDLSFNGSGNAVISEISRSHISGKDTVGILRFIVSYLQIQREQFPRINRFLASITLEKMTTAPQIWLQKQVTLQQRSRGCHLITHEVESAIRSQLRQIGVGICHIFIMHTSAVCS